MKTFIVVCSKHGEYEVTPHESNETYECPTRCVIVERGKVCGLSLTRRYTAPAVHYKGTGFYRTDND